MTNVSASPGTLYAQILHPSDAMMFQKGDKVVVHSPEVDMYVIGLVVEADTELFKVQLSDGTVVPERQGSEIFEPVH